MNRSKTNSAQPRYPAYKPTNIPWLPQIPEAWEVAMVGHCYDIQLGKMLCSEKRDASYSLEPYYCAANVHFEGVQATGLKQMWFSEEEKSVYRVSKGDLLIVEGGAGAGGSAIVNHRQEAYIQNSILRVRHHANTDNSFLCYWMESIVKRGYVDVVCNKATIPHFTKEKVSRVSFPLPPLPTQRAIVAYLDEKCGKVDRLVAAKEKEAALLRELKQSVIAEAVTRGAPRKQRRRLVPSGIPWLPEVPEGWEVKRLKSLFSLRHESYSPDEQLMVLSLIKDIGVIPYDDKGSVGNKSKEDISGYNVARKGDVVMNSMNVIIGSVDITPYDGYIVNAH
ncbi:MAG: restriction endonuclease subunit S [Kiritimatiellia bacterium]